MKWLKKLQLKFLNSNFWFYCYYKHTQQHKDDLAAVQARVTARIKELLGK